jgi:hypothetical protein
MKKLILGVGVLMAVLTVKAQNKTSNSLTYKTAAGIRIWDGAGLSLKTFFKDDGKSALEFFGFFNGDGIRITGLYEMHGDLSTEGNLKWYFGGGAHVGLYSKDIGTTIGIDGVIGIDYKFKELPLNLSLDWQPTFEFASSRGFNGNWGALGVRYTF